MEDTELRGTLYVGPEVIVAIRELTVPDCKVEYSHKSARSLLVIFAIVEVVSGGPGKRGTKVHLLEEEVPQSPWGGEAGSEHLRFGQSCPAIIVYRQSDTQMCHMG